MVDINKLTDLGFASLPLVIKGESKEVRYAGNGMVVIRFLPTIYSFTNNRCEVVPGSEIPRLRASAILVDVLRKAGIRHAYREVNDRFVLADLVMPSEVEFEKYDLPVFTPPDLTEDEIADLPKAPPIEVVVKRYLTGTTKHGCIGMARSRVRSSHPFYANLQLIGDGALPEMIVRFDWRNPLKQPGRGARLAEQIIDPLSLMGGFKNIAREAVSSWGDRVADVCLPEQLADLYIDVDRARQTAFLTAKSIEEFLATKDIVFYDLCLFVTEDGNMVYGEISPDCGRYRHLDLGSLDKDVWRAGGSSADVIQKWQLLCDLMTKEAT